MAIWYILWSFGTFCGHLVYFSHFGMLYREKSGNPDTPTERTQTQKENFPSWNETYLKRYKF
jgi:hypothetical protein